MVFISGAGAQEPPDSHWVNTETYRLYVNQQWDSLLVTGRSALRRDMDYYYLRMRMGIARYEQKNYRKAITHFDRALQFNQGDPVALEYLYYCRLLSGQDEAAALVRKQFRGDLALRLPPGGGRFFHRIGLEYLYNRGIRAEDYVRPSVYLPALAPGVQYTTSHFSNAFFTLVNSIVPGFSLQHAYTFLAKTNHFYYYDGIYQFHMDDQQVNQHQYYFSPRISWRSGLSIQPFLHLLGGHYQYPVQFIPGFMGGSGQVVVGTPDYLDLVTGLGLTFDLGSFTLRTEGSYATLNQSRQGMGRVGAVWYPMGNLNFYTGAFLAGQAEWTGGMETFRMIPEVLLGLSVAGRVWLDLDASLGEMTNYSESFGLIVYNSFTEVILKKVRGSLSFLVSEKGSLVYIGGRWSATRSEYAPFGTASEITNTLTYNTLSIYGGLSWKF